MRLIVLGLVAACLSGCGDGGGSSVDTSTAPAGFVPPAVMSRLDWGGQQERRFNELDRNADGKLTPDEFPRANSRIQRADANGDGEVTKGEFSDATIARFDRMDLNKDGTVTSEEQETTRNGTLAPD
ncbi:EF-hand domain-containing protein [Sphingomonas lenta]|uniref:EF-hand domain-containing protein n=1 Tax=Sphingomonas lenta TaxID=1141887 RepID=A0A2A2SFZ6_9SPHN|nr:EF-hand domain-containing protein [Sphingomonas lenta]PAX08148.1 hypothetical protein CKY28_11240 [Sphingomonas lenta]